MRKTFKNRVRESLFDGLDSLFSHPRFRQRLFDLLSNSPFRTRFDAVALPEHDALPYALGQAAAAETADRARPIFVSARFRTGSTLLWRLLRESGQFTAFYEPLNERQWFNAASRGDVVDGTHSGVRDYWREYAGMEALGDYFDPSWNRQNLWMDAHHQDAAMFGYISSLIANAEQRPVLQFNRVDFRLAWLRAHFPDALIVHLFRNPRDQWFSTVSRKDRTKLTTLREFQAQDGYYLLAWCKDLKYRFPVLDQCWDEHPYVAFYVLWRLSHAFGRHHADCGVSYEDLVQDPASALAEFCALAGIEFSQLGERHSITATSVDKYKKFASEDWFSEQESRAEALLEAHYVSP